MYEGYEGLGWSRQIYKPLDQDCQEMSASRQFTNIMHDLRSWNRYKPTEGAEDLIIGRVIRYLVALRFDETHPW